MQRGILQTLTAPGDVSEDSVPDRGSIPLVSTRFKLPTCSWRRTGPRCGAPAELAEQGGVLIHKFLSCKRLFIGSLSDMEDKKKLEIYESASIPKAVMINALQATGAAIPALLISMSRQGLIFIPAVFILQAIVGLNGLIWAQPLADILSLAIAALLFYMTVKRKQMKDLEGMQKSEYEVNSNWDE